MAAAAAQQQMSRDSLQTFVQQQQTQPVYYDGPTSIRERDSYMPQFPNRVGPQSQRANSPSSNPYMKWPDGAANRMRPVVYRPNGSFAALQKQGKMEHSQTGEYRQQMTAKKSFMPGYTGFVRGSQHISGRTFGEATRRALDTDYRENLCTSPIPSAPQSNRKVRQEELANTFVTNTFGDRVYQLPGYTGHVPGVRATYSKTYGSTTSQEMNRWGSLTQRANPQERPGFAYTQRPRQMLVIDSAPLPGMTKTEKNPEKLIPAHLRYLKFLSM